MDIVLNYLGGPNAIIRVLKCGTDRSSVSARVMGHKKVLPGHG